MKCRHCQTPLTHIFADLGSAPPSNAYLTKDSLSQYEKWYPLRVMVCDQCWLVQTEDFADADELFDDEYAYFSSFSSSWLKHAEQYVEGMVERFALASDSHVVEIAANDGYLLQFVKQRDIPCTGVEPTHSTAQAARDKNIPIIEDFFGVKLANELVAKGKQADLIAANNVLAHVPDINDFVAGFATLLKPNGVCTFEFPHLMQLVRHNQFDTIYHEHFSYLSLTAIDEIFKKNGLEIFDVEQLATHGGSLRVFAQRQDTAIHLKSVSVDKIKTEEAQEGLTTLQYYSGFQAQIDKVKDNALTFLLNAKSNGKTVIAYGAAAKGNTLLNYAGIRPDLIKCVVDRNPSKQNKFMPGSRIPIVDEGEIRRLKPDYVFILPWNLKDEITAQLSYVRDWGGQFVTSTPSLTIE